MPLASIEWTQVLIASIAAVPATIAAWASLSNRTSLKTPSGTTVGKQVENAHHVALANNYRLQALGDGFEVPMPEQALTEEARVEKLFGEEGKKT